MTDNVNQVAKDLLSKIKKCSESDVIINPDDIDGIIELQGGEAIEWVAQTFSDNAMVNLYKCSNPDSNDTYVASYHSDGGRLAGATGPYSSIEDAQAHIQTDEGWTFV